MSNELQKQVDELKAELAALQDSVRRTFEAIGFGTDWSQTRPRTAPSSPEIAAKILEISVKPPSVNDHLLNICRSVLEKAATAKAEGDSQ
jgi:hypothetical protein